MMMMKRERVQKTESCRPSVKPAKSQSIFAPRPFAPPVEEHEAPAAGPVTGFNFADISILPRETVQPKLILGPVGDKYEQEADRVARWVVDTISSPEQGAVQREEDLEDEEVPELEEMLEEEEEPIQGKFASGLTDTLQTKEEAPSNKTGMPDHLKSGLENLSGLDLSGVHVHYNSPKPARLNALAYTQGQEIYLAPGQERHLPHEGWHAVQQMQGRVRPTRQMKGLGINSDPVLERGADVMGRAAMRGRAMAYAQGTDIRMGPVQERHLAHEDWHVAQHRTREKQEGQKASDLDVTQCYGQATWEQKHYAFTDHRQDFDAAAAWAGNQPKASRKFYLGPRNVTFNIHKGGRGRKQNIGPPQGTGYIRNRTALNPNWSISANDAMIEGLSSVDTRFRIASKEGQAIYDFLTQNNIHDSNTLFLRLKNMLGLGQCPDWALSTTNRTEFSVTMREIGILLDEGYNPQISNRKPGKEGAKGKKLTFIPPPPGAQPPQAQPPRPRLNIVRRRSQPNSVSFSLADISILPRPLVQPKLRLGPVGDRYEQEADRVARQVVDTISSSDGGAVQRREDLEDEEEPEIEEGEELRRKVTGIAPAAGADVGMDLESAIQRARGRGQPLSDAVRRPMERAFGADFGGVRVHADDEADSLNRSLQARAFTAGQDIFLRQGEYRPGSSEGQRLLAHELTHVVQQKGGAVQRAQMQATGRVLQAKEDVTPNRTGMPDHLKSGLENISGMDLSGVRVHYNSSKPAQLNALAYTQGQEIHVVSGQERHLPHEAWHVVQQAQGRVKPTMQLKDGVPVNDDEGLEHEADVMGAKAVQMKAEPESVQQRHAGRFEGYRLKSLNPTTQRVQVIQLYDSVPRDRFHSAVFNLHGEWKKGSDERTMTVWQIANIQKWDFHFTAMYDSTGDNVTKFHFTIRNGNKGDDAFAWFKVVGHNRAATLGVRENAGNAQYWAVGSVDYKRIPRKIRSQFASINQWATSILQTTVSYIPSV